MKKFLFALLILLLALPAWTQDQDYTKAADNDPAAKAILDKLRAKYEGYSTIEANFTLAMEIPEQPEEIQKGTLIQKGDKYRLDMASQAVISDGKSVWLYLKDMDEVQINNAEVEEEEETVMSPKDILRIYESENFVYVLVNEGMEDGRVVQQIEFKPLEDDAEYFKLRLTVDRDKTQVKRIKAFAKDGSRYTLSINSFNTDKSFSDARFVWNDSECPDCYVEDLRID